MSILRILLSLLTPCLALAAAGCGLGTRSTDSQDPLQHPDLLTPVAEAREAGVTPYWLGREFQAGPLLFDISAYAALIRRAGKGPGVGFEYGAPTGEGNVVLLLDSYSEESGVAAIRREEALRIRGATSREVRVGAWEGELLSLPGGTRPVNHLVLHVDVGNTVVVARAASGRTGVPGEDPNSLIQADLLIEVMEQLRPYPE